MELHRLYHPLTATPLGRSSYAEVLPCAALQPFIHCFWYSHASPHPAALVIPDTCMDLLFVQQDDSIRCVFCALCDQTFLSSHQSRIPFAIRFYPWAAAMFADMPLDGTLNLSLDAHLHFPLLCKELLRMIECTYTFEQRYEQAQSLLYRRLERQRMSADFLNATHEMLHSEGRARIETVARSVQLSQRQLERLFSRQTGASPKKLASMIRYQYLWRDAVLSSHFDIQDAVYRYGYTDQSHLLHQFRQYHSLTLTEALAYAQKHVLHAGRSF